ncbi:mpv17-like protein 2 [Asbolus verrucosus]|uniref:Mpv17-like protein 2 n=1 Tax=Asbolus verrucosus TaxID=1661398 RepID=A0A482W1E5_ASBVE|nr:mpv17-like protein 2 [Asbolus verrucosus]
MFRKGSSLICRKISTSHSLRNRIRVTVKAAFGKYLFLTNTVSSGVLMLMGDAIQQELSYQSKALTSHLPRDETRFDYGQMSMRFVIIIEQLSNEFFAARMFLVGLGMGPTHHYYYRYISILWPKRDMMSITKKIAADQFIMSPICIAQFFVTIDGLVHLASSPVY